MANQIEANESFEPTISSRGNSLGIFINAMVNPAAFSGNWTLKRIVRTGAAALGLGFVLFGEVACGAVDPTSNPVAASTQAPSKPPVNETKPMNMDEALVDFSDEPYQELNSSPANLSTDANALANKIQQLIDITPRTTARAKVIDHGDGTKTSIILPPSNAEGFYKGVDVLKERPGTTGLQVAEPTQVRLNYDTIDGLRFLLPDLIAKYNSYYPDTKASTINRETYMVIGPLGGDLHNTIDLGNAFILEAGSDKDHVKYVIVTGGPITTIGHNSLGENFAFTQAAYYNPRIKTNRVSALDVNKGPIVELLQAWTTTSDNDGISKEQMNNDLSLMIGVIAEGRGYSDYVKEVEGLNAATHKNLQINARKLPEEFFDFVNNSGRIRGNIVIVP